MKLEKKKPIRILLVDDHPIVRHGMRQLIEVEEDMMVCGEAADAIEGLSVLQSSNPDMAIVDISMEGKNGIELIKDIRVRQKDFPIIVLSVHSEVTYAERALKAGAQGYILKQEAPGIIISAIRKIMGGNIFVCERMASKLLSKLAPSRSTGFDDSPVACLSDRELEILEMIGHGQGPKQISETLNISVNTVQTYRSRIKVKLNLKTAAEPVKFATEWLRSQQ